MALTAERIASRQATVGVIGLGYVGLPLALVFAEAGFAVVGFDIDPAKIDALTAGRSYIGHIADARIAAARARFSSTADFARAAGCDALIICVPTPLDAHLDPD